MQHGEREHADQLAEVHLALGDLSTEKEDFDSAVTELSRCLQLLETTPALLGDRRRWAPWAQQHARPP